MSRTIVKASTVPEYDWPAPPNCIRMGNTVYISGQVAWDGKRNVIGVGDAYMQAKVVFSNIRDLMRAAGGDVEDIGQITMFVTDIRYQPDVWRARAEIFGQFIPCSTLICVHSLFVPGLLVEVEARGTIDAAKRRPHA